MSGPWLGVHASDAGGIDQAVRRAAATGLRAVQLFTAPPSYYNEKVRVKPDRAARVRAACAEVGFTGAQVLVHAGYVLNTASPEPEKATRARAALARELERTTAIGAFGCCFHPGSAGTGDPDGAAVQVGEAIHAALEAVPDGARVLVENTAGAGRTMGRSPGEIARMLSQVPAALRARAGYGLDTCHLHAAGHDITSSPGALRGTLDRFCEAIGEAPAFFHLNDSQHPAGSNKDRHALVGEGTIGVAPFGWLLRDPRAQGIPCILETPQARAEVADDDLSPDPWDVRMRELLEGLLAG